MVGQRTYGRGISRFVQELTKLTDRRAKLLSANIELATAISDNTIQLDRDGYHIYSEEGDFIVLNGVYYESGDRIVVMTLGGTRGQVVVLGGWNPSTVLSFPTPHAEIYVSSSGFTSISDSSNFFLAAGTYTNSVPGREFTHSGGRLTYTGELPRMFHIFVSCGISHDSINSRKIEIAIRKNGDVVVPSIMGGISDQEPNDRNNSLNSMVSLEKGDIIDVAVRNLTDTEDMQFDYLNIGISGMSFHNSVIGIP